MSEAPASATSAPNRRPSSASPRWSAPGSSRCSAPLARSPALPSGCRSCSPAASPRCRGIRSPSSVPSSRRPAACSSTSTGFGDGHVATVVAWLTYIANGIVTAMVALSFGSYASSAFAGDNAASGEDLRRRPAHDDDHPQHRRLERGRPRPEPRGLRRHRHPGVLLHRRRSRTSNPATSRPRPIPVPRTSCRASR